VHLVGSIIESNTQGLVHNTHHTCTSLWTGWRLLQAGAYKLQYTGSLYNTQDTSFHALLSNYAMITCYICSILLSLVLVPVSCLCVTDAPFRTSDCTSEICGPHCSLV